jgi:hypothetical protein
MEDAMRFLIRFLIVSFICLIGIGLCLGWFIVSKSDPEPETGKVNINVSVDKAKMESDIKKAEEKVEEKVEKFESRMKAKKTASPPATPAR